MERTQKIRQQGYIAIDRLLEINRDALRAMERSTERLTAGKRLIREITGWCAMSNEEALGILESSKFKFIQDAEDKIEMMK